MSTDTPIQDDLAREQLIELAAEIYDQFEDG